MTETVLRRTIGPGGPEISQITYGTMRLRGSVGEAADLLRHLHDHGITTHHSCHEYDTHNLYLEALRKAQPGRSFEHIVKLSSPSFDSDRFDAKTMRDLVEAELASLGTDQLASVQWLVRTPDAQDLQRRLAVLEQQAVEIGTCFTEMVEAGDIANISVFTYHPDFADPAMNALPSRTICDYLNLAETDLCGHLDRVDSYLAIRPLGGGTLLTDVATALRWPLLHPKVSTIILSANDASHVAQAIDSAGQTLPDQSSFEAALDQARHGE
jgi:aryl-alcohol dehydrogenase-like predicted oxidoreductase